MFAFLALNHLFFSVFDLRCLLLGLGDLSAVSDAEAGPFEEEIFCSDVRKNGDNKSHCKLVSCLRHLELFCR